MKTLLQIIKTLRAELSAVTAVLVQHFLGIAPQIPWWATGGIVFLASRVGTLTKTVDAEVDWLNRRVLSLELRISSLTKSTYHPETYTREGVKDLYAWAPTVYQLFDPKGAQCAVRFKELPQFMSFQAHDSKYRLWTDLEPQEVPVDKDDPEGAKRYRYKTLVLEGVTKQEVLDYVDRVAPRQLSSDRNVLFER